MEEREVRPGPTGIPGPERSRLRLAGLGASAISLGVVWALSGFVAGVPFPPSALAQIIVRATPGDIATFFIERLGHLALQSLTIGATIGALAVGAEALVRSGGRGWPRPRMAAAFLAVLSAIVSLAAPMAGNEPIAIVFVTLGAAVAYNLSAGLLYEHLIAPGRETDEGRRRTLRLGLGGAAALALAGGVVGWLGRRLAGPDRDVKLARAVEPAVLPDRPPFPEKIAGLSPEITSAEDHYVVDINLFKPSVEADGWTLDVTGLVEQPLSLTFAALQERFEIVEEYSVLTCISNEVGGPLIGNSAWGGVRLAEVLDSAGVRDGAADVVFRSAEGYSDSISIDFARDPHVLLAISQNGQPLTQEHGFPCRVRVPPIFGMKNVKWLTEIEIVGNDYSGYWQRRGWSDEAIVRTQSRIDVPEDGAALRSGERTWIAGVAWAGDRGVAKVEVSTDGGETWTGADVREPAAENAWSQWAYAWVPEGTGEVRIACRATDGEGEVQTARRSTPHPSGATGYHIIEVEVS